MAERKIAQANELSICTESRCVRQSVIEKRVRGGEPRIFAVHPGQIYQAFVRQIRPASDVRREDVTACARSAGRHGRWRGDEGHTVTLFDGESRDLIFVVIHRALAGDHAVLPAVPWTLNELTEKPASQSGLHLWLQRLAIAHN